MKADKQNAYHTSLKYAEPQREQQTAPGGYGHMPNSAMVDLYDTTDAHELERLKSTQFNLDEALKARLEARFGVPLAGLKVYEDEGLLDMGREAYAQGNEVHLGMSAAQANSTAKEAVLAHEIAHVVQQGTGAARGIGVLDDPALEAQAHAGFAASEGFAMPQSAQGAPIQSLRTPRQAYRARKARKAQELAQVAEAVSSGPGAIERSSNPDTQALPEAFGAPKESMTGASAGFASRATGIVGIIPTTIASLGATAGRTVAKTSDLLPTGSLPVLGDIGQATRPVNDFLGSNVGQGLAGGAIGAGAAGMMMGGAAAAVGSGMKAHKHRKMGLKDDTAIESLEAIQGILGVAGGAANVASVAGQAGVAAASTAMPIVNMVTGGLNVAKGSVEAHSGRTRRRDMDAMMVEERVSGHDAETRRRRLQILGQGRRVAKQREVAGGLDITTGLLDIAAGGLTLGGVTAPAGMALTGVSAGLKVAKGVAGYAMGRSHRNKTIDEALGVDLGAEIEAVKKTHGISSKQARQMTLMRMGFETGSRDEAFQIITMNRARYLTDAANDPSHPDHTFAAKTVKSLRVSQVKGEGGQEGYSLQAVAERLGMQSGSSWQQQMAKTRKAEMGSSKKVRTAFGQVRTLRSGQIAQRAVPDPAARANQAGITAELSERFAARAAAPALPTTPAPPLPPTTLTPPLPPSHAAPLPPQPAPQPSAQPAGGPGNDPAYMAQYRAAGRALSESMGEAVDGDPAAMEELWPAPSQPQKKSRLARWFGRS